MNEGLYDSVGAAAKAHPDCIVEVVSEGVCRVHIPGRVPLPQRIRDALLGEADIPVVRVRDGEPVMSDMERYLARFCEWRRKAAATVPDVCRDHEGWKADAERIRGHLAEPERAGSVEDDGWRDLPCIELNEAGLWPEVRLADDRIEFHVGGEEGHPLVGYEHTVTFEPKEHETREAAAERHIRRLWLDLARKAIEGWRWEG